MINQIIRNCLLIPYSLFASCFDIRKQKIPNKLIIIGYLMGIFYCFSYHGFDEASLERYLIKILIPFILIILSIFHKIGMGDIKFISTVCGFLTEREIVSWLLLAIIIEGIAFVVMRRKKLPFLPALSISLWVMLI